MAAHGPSASTSRLSLSSDVTVESHFPQGGHEQPYLQARETNGARSKRAGQYAISTVLTDSNAPPALLTSFPSLAANPYIPHSLSSLGTAFTSSALPRASASSKSVAQRRSAAPPVVISESRKVLRSEFDKYLSELGPEWQRWEQERKLGRTGRLDLGENGVGETSEGSVGGTDEGDSRRRVVEDVLPPLEGVPQIFFDPSFALSNPRTFDLVTERIRSDSRPNQFAPLNGSGPSTLADLATDEILQEKLSNYTAVIESHLVREIGLRSSSFFSALSNLQSLHEQGENCLSKITDLQSALSTDEMGIGGAAKRGLHILRTQARRRGLEKIEEGVRSVEEVWNGVEGVKELVEHGEWLGALEVSEQVEALYYGQDTAEDVPVSSTSTGPTFDLVVVDDSSPLPPPTSSRPPKRTRLNLTKVKALNSVPQRLATFRATVAKSLEGELIGVLEHEMEVGVQEYMRSAATGSWKGKRTVETPVSPSGRTRSPAISFVDEGGDAGEDLARERAKERVRPVVRGLVRAEGMEGAVAAWREAMLKDVRLMVREHLPMSDSPTVDEQDGFAQFSNRNSDLSSVTEKSASLARNLRAMSHGAFLSLARDTYLGLLGCIELVDLHAKVLLDLVADMRVEEDARRARRLPPPPSLTTPSSPSSLKVPTDTPPRPTRTSSLSTLDTSPSKDHQDLASDISDVIHATAELANLRFSKIISVRTDLHSTLSLAEFVEIFDASWDFVVQCEVICRKMIVGLRGIMVGQAKAFLQAYHQKRITESAKVVENEQWGAAEVPRKTQRVVELILQSAVSDPTEFLLGNRARGREKEEEVEGGEKKKQLDIEGREYFAVAAGLASVEVLADYLKVVVNCPILTTDVMSKVVEYMKSFNSRTCQVVLGAGAMRSAGLKNITAKHLALASQALSIMISLIPYIRETLRRHLNPKQAVMLIEFDKLKRDFQEHQNEIHSKLVAIMSDRLQIHCKTLETINWEVPVPGRAEGTPNIYMEALVKEHTTLHKVLSRFLQLPTVEFIMMQVFSALNAGLAEEYSKIEVKTEAAKERMRVDVVYLKVKLAELKGMERGTPGAELENLIATKRLPIPLVPLLRRASTIVNTPLPASLPSSPIPTPTPLPSSPAPLDPPTPRSESPLPIPPSQPTTPVIPKAAPRKSMAERLNEIARRGSGDLPPALKPVIVHPPSPVLEVVDEVVASPIEIAKQEVRTEVVVEKEEEKEEEKEVPELPVGSFKEAVVVTEEPEEEAPVVVVEPIIVEDTSAKVVGEVSPTPVPIVEKEKAVMEEVERGEESVQVKLGGEVDESFEDEEDGSFL